VNIVNNNNQTALHLAAYQGHSDVMKELLGCKADVNVRDKNGKTPLRIAAKYGYLNAVKTCSTYGAYVNLKDFDNKTALHYAGALTGYFWAEYKEQIIALLQKTCQN